LAVVPQKDDSITRLIDQVGGVLDHLNSDLLGRLSLVLGDLDSILVQVQNALAGDNTSPLGRTFTGVDTLMNGSLEPILADIKQISSHLSLLTGELAEPQGAVRKVLDGDGAVYENLEASLKAIAGTLGNLEKVSAFLPSQLPQVAALLTELRTTLKTAEDVLIALTNNPLLKGGIPQAADTQSGGISPRDIPF
jgi:phospholipid/cholesterol/gamma-HCH transport system substrate-binding protein